MGKELWGCVVSLSAVQHSQRNNQPVQNDATTKQIRKQLLTVQVENASHFNTMVSLLAPPLRGFCCVVQMHYLVTLFWLGTYLVCHRTFYR